MYDSPNLTDQPSLTTSSGKIWLIAGGLLAFISSAVLFPMMWLEPPGVAIWGIIAIVVLYVAMIVVRLTVDRQRVRLAVLAFLMMAIAIAFFISAGIITATEWNF
jgi:hypothetical protein